MMTAQASSIEVPIDIVQHSRDYALIIRDEAFLEIHGKMIGFATSFREDHTHPTRNHANAQLYVPSGTRCSACRWFEVRIFVVEHAYTEDCTCDAVDDDDHIDECGIIAPQGKYLVLTYGITRVPGENHKRRAAWTNSPFEIIEILTQRNASGPFLPATSARVISQAAASDRGIQNAYINRAVI